MVWFLKGRTAIGRLLGRAGDPEPPEMTAPEVTIVRRDLSPEYYFFFEIFARQNGLKVIVDRRVDDRRRRPGDVPEDRRSTDRRSSPPPTWTQADIVVPPQDRQATAPIRPPLAVVPPPQR